jgi:hypothetical protein
MRNESLLVLRRQERIRMYTENPRSVSVHIRRTRRIRKIFRQNLALRICWLRGMNLFVYWEYAELICLDIDKYMEWPCMHTENTQNAWKVEYLIKFEKNRKYFMMFIISPDEFVWSNHLKQKISCKCTYKVKGHRLLELSFCWLVSPSEPLIDNNNVFSRFHHRDSPSPGWFCAVGEQLNPTD